MIVILVALGGLLLIAVLLLEEAAVWYGGNAVVMLEDEDAAEEGVEFARRARESRLLGQMMLALAMAVLAAAGGGESATARGGFLAGAVLLAAMGAALLASHWRSPWNLAGRVLFQPLGWLGRFLFRLAGMAGRLGGVPAEERVEDRIREIDQELRWIQGRTAEDEAEEVLATLQEFGESVVEEVMVPRGDVAGLPAEATVAEALALVREEGFSRYPVYRESMDNVVGVLHVFDLLEADPRERVSALARPPLITTETKPVAELLGELQHSYNQMAVVADEFGGTAGVVTVEDLIEELVGEIRDETDEDEAPLKPLEPGVFWVDGSMRVEDLNEALELELREGEYDTVAGLILERLERIPRAGERIRENGVWFEVVAAEPHRINAVRMTIEEKR